ncbi:oxidoreductase [Vibrio sp. JC009]|uniref:iron-sulfur cluster-binding protein n=1 Tax=Vibrio sp. JC009 TaxID=2912314 RepID=UPI0023B014E0|nr:oxidoreductase [Vibrio sp. JC009]WED23706.1 oxidoreductase [Vibrio sp. JC009]
MHDLTPQPIRLIRCYDDGQDIKHFTFEAADKSKGLPDFANPDVVQPGQFFMLSIPGFGEAAFTYASMPDKEGRFNALIRRIGSLTDALFLHEEGDLLGARGPFGKGWPDLKGTKVLVVAGGVGLAPVAAEIDALISAGSAPVVYFSARNEAMLVMKEERARWENQCTLYQAVDDIDNAKGDFLPGRKLADNLHFIEEKQGPFDHVITCGPEGMMEAVCKIVAQHGHPANRIWLSLERRMHCGVGLCGHCYVADDLVCLDGPTYRWDQLGELVVKEKAIKPPTEPVAMVGETGKCCRS